MRLSHSPLARLRYLIDLEQEDIKTLVAYGVGIGLMSLATPVAVQALVNTISFGALFQPLVVLTLILLVLVGFSNLLAALQFYVVDILQRRLFVRLLGQSASNLQNVAYPVHDKQHLPELTNRFLDVVTLQKTASVLLLETLGYFLQTVIGMILLAFYHPLLLAFDLFLIAAIAFILFVLGKGGTATAIQQSKAKYAALAWLEAIAASPVLGKSNQDFLTAQTDRIAYEYLETSAQHFRVLARQNAGALLLHTLANTLLLGMGGWMVIERQLSLGQLIAAELVVNAMIYGLTRLGKTLDNFYELLASTDKLNYLLELPQEAADGNNPVVNEHPFRVEVSNVSLPQNPDHDRILGINLQLARGESLVVTDGADKGSLFDALYGLRIPVTGYICLDGQDLRDLHLGKLRDSIALVRTPEILELTVLDNIRLGRKMDLEAVRKALAKVSLLNDIVALPDGLNTPLCVNGKPLTYEQCLRLTLARAIAAKPKLLLLDHVIDRIDSRFVNDIVENLTAVDAPWTLLLTSRNPYVIARCSRQAKIENGLLVEQQPAHEGGIK